MKRIKNFRSNEEGQGIVEFALVLPIFIMFLLGIIEFGWMFNAQITTTSAAREGARTRAIMGITTDPVKVLSFDTAAEEVVRQSALPTIPEDKIEATFINITENSINGVFIQCDVEAVVKPLVGFFIRGDQILTATATFRVE
ncbi:pilus assembly protein [Proteiniclasticum sp. SCR006]|uniref:Pilus assembly protein n=1 Tax=Proteiniclasticum aestuarii TaxID=2817862 RepID=A0A939HA51_9CLOT|nr:TadE/TadG family type IV pilus assembly protein [Proteiniclasticum aestuarii]MBO1265986.1 pilus assembly protein [Proteiniclasticum aestuarii]